MKTCNFSSANLKDLKERLTAEDAAVYMANYRSGDARKREEAVIRMIAGLEKMILSEIHKKYSEFAKDTDIAETLYMAAISKIVEALETYDEKLSSPSTYFLPIITNALYVCVNEEIKGNTIHYTQTDTKIREVEKKYEQRGEIPTVEILARESKLPVTTIINTLARRKFLATAPIEEAESYSSSYGSPEDIYFKNEAADTIHMQIEKLSPEEKNVIYAMHFSDRTKSEAEVAEELNITIDKYNKIHNRALDKLKKSIQLQQYFGFKDSGRAILDNIELVIMPVNSSEIMSDPFGELTMGISF